MKINFAQPFRTLDGSVMVDEQGNEILFSKSIGNQIFQVPDKENPLATYELAKKIYTQTEPMDFSKTEIAIIKEKVKETFISGFAGQVLELILDSEK